MAVFVFHHVRSHAGRRPNRDVELQRNLDLSDGDERMRGVGLLCLASYPDIGEEIRIALRLFACTKRGHIGWSVGGIECTIGECDGLFIDDRRRRFRPQPRSISATEANGDERSQQDAKPN